MKVETEFLEVMTGERMGTEVIKLDGTFPFFIQVLDLF